MFKHFDMKNCISKSIFMKKKIQLDIDNLNVDKLFCKTDKEYYQQMIENLNSNSSSIDLSSISTVPAVLSDSAPLIPVNSSAPPLAATNSALPLAITRSDSSNFIAKPNKPYIPVKNILELFKLKKNEYNNILVRKIIVKFILLVY